MTCLDECEKFPELVAASYRDSHSVQSTSADKDGLVCIWNMDYVKDVPEFVLSLMHLSVTRHKRNIP